MWLVHSTVTKPSHSERILDTPDAFPFYIYMCLYFPSQSLTMNPETIKGSYCIDFMAAGATFERDQTTWQQDG